MKVEKLKEVIEIVSEANKEDVKRRRRDMPSSAAEISIGTDFARICFSSLGANAVASLVDAGFDVEIGDGASIYWREEGQGE